MRDEGSVPEVMVRNGRWRKSEECSDPGRQERFQGSENKHLHNYVSVMVSSILGL